MLYAGLYSSKGASFKVLQAIEKDRLKKDRLKIVISTTLLFEYEDILKRNQAILGLSDGEIERLLDYFCLKSDHQRIHFLWRPQLPDQKDDHILELAVASGTGLIVTYNAKDFKGIASFGVRSITPKELVEGIL